MKALRLYPCNWHNFKPGVVLIAKFCVNVAFLRCLTHFSHIAPSPIHGSLCRITQRYGGCRVTQHYFQTVK